MNMNTKRRMKQKKRVSWPSDDNLYQVRLFLSDESPSQVGLNSQGLQAKASWMLHSHGKDPNDNLPPGFELAKPAIRMNTVLPHVPVIKWKCPQKVVLNDSWLVVAGQESVDADLQTRREMRVLEAIYPRQSAIPHNPIFPLELEDSRHHERQIPLIPITAIEDEDGNGEPSYESMYGADSPSVSNHSKRDVSATGTTKDAQPDIALAVSAAITAIMKTNEQGSMIDQELLIQILNDPTLLEKMLSNHANVPQKTSLPHLAPVSSSVLAPMENIGIEKMATNYCVAASNPKTPSPPLPPITSSTADHTQNKRIERMSTDYGPGTANPKTPSPPYLPPISSFTSGHAQNTRIERMATDYSLATANAKNSSPPNLPPITSFSPAPTQNTRIERMMTDYGPATSNPKNSSMPNLLPMHIAGPVHTQMNRNETSGISSEAPSSNGLYYPRPESTAVPFRMTQAPSPCVVPIVSQPSLVGDTRKDWNYYKSLIQEHGEEKKRHETAIKERDVKTMTKCIYFNTRRGCRRGASCAFAHDQDNSFPEMQSAKRIKFDREIKGR